MVQCHKSIMVIGSNPSKTRQNESRKTLFYFRSQKYSPLRLFASAEISRAIPGGCVLVQPEMEKRRSPLVSLPPSGGDFQGMGSFDPMEVGRPKNESSRPSPSSPSAHRDYPSA